MENDLPGITNEIIYIPLDESWLGKGSEIKGIVIDEVLVTHEEFKYYLKVFEDNKEILEDLGMFIVYGTKDAKEVL